MSAVYGLHSSGKILPDLDSMNENIIEKGLFVAVVHEQLLPRSSPPSPVYQHNSMKSILLRMIAPSICRTCRKLYNIIKLYMRKPDHV